MQIPYCGYLGFPSGRILFKKWVCKDRRSEKLLAGTCKNHSPENDMMKKWFLLLLLPMWILAGPNEIELFIYWQPKLLGEESFGEKGPSLLRQIGEKVRERGWKIQSWDF